MPQKKRLNTFFKNLRVVELAGVLAGPSVGQFFAELGAKVIKIENPKTNGDVTRSWKLASENPSKKTSAYFLSINRGKKHLFLNLTKNSDSERLKKIIADADILISNFKKGDANKFGLNYPKLKKLNPRLIVAQLSGFGEDSDRLAYDLILQAESGFMSMNGTKESGPLKMPVALIDLIAGHILKEAVLIALLKREKSGKGSYIRTSLMDCAISSLANQAANFLFVGQTPQLAGSLHPNIAPYGEIFKSKDKIQFTLAIGSDRHFSDLMQILNLKPEFWMSNYQNNQLRVKNRGQLFSIINAETTKRTFHELEDIFQSAGIPYGQIKNLKQVLSSESIKNTFISMNSEEGKIQFPAQLPVTFT